MINKRVRTLITDFSPLRIKRAWEESIARKIDIPFYQVDAHNIVPCWIASSKQEYSAYTFRPKISRALPEFLVDYPPLKNHPFSWKREITVTDWKRSLKTLDVDLNVPETDWIEPGEKAAYRVMHNFLENKLLHYHEQRNDPTKDVHQTSLLISILVRFQPK